MNTSTRNHAVALLSMRLWIYTTTRDTTQDYDTPPSGPAHLRESRTPAAPGQAGSRPHRGDAKTTTSRMNRSWVQSIKKLPHLRSVGAYRRATSPQYLGPLTTTVDYGDHHVHLRPPAANPAVHWTRALDWFSSYSCRAPNSCGCQAFVL